MERLRKTFTCLVLFSTLLGIAPIMVSCQQSTNKQKPATEGTSQTSQPGTAPAVVNQQPQKPSGSAVSNEAVQGKTIEHQVVLEPNFGKKSNSQNSKLLNAFDNKLGENTDPSSGAKMNPEQKKSHELYLSGSRKSKEGDQTGAIEDFTQSLNLYKTAITYFKRGFTELLLEDYNSALTDMNEAIKMSPSFYKAYFGRGVCRFQLKDYKTAEEDLRVFIEKDKTTPMAYNYLAGCLFIKQDIKGALENYEMVAKLDPKYPDIYTNRGMMKHYLNDLKGAVEDYNKALAIDPDNATAYNNRGGAKLSQEDPKAALADFNKAISLKNDYPDAYLNRGKAKYSLEDKKGACEDWHKAYSLGIEIAGKLIDEYCK